MDRVRLLDCEEFQNGYPEAESKIHSKDGG